MRALGLLGEGGEHAVVSQLESIFGDAAAVQQADDSRSVAPVNHSPVARFSAP